MKKLTKEEFVNKSIEKFGDKFNFEETEYNGTKKSIIYYCKEHNHLIERVARSHLQLGNCPECEGMIKNLASFKRRALLVHNDKFNYDMVQYINPKTKIEVICNKHNISFWVRPSSHLDGAGSCPECVKESARIAQTYTLEEFLTKANDVHNDGLYDLSKVCYINSSTKIEIFCNKHKILFKIRPTTFLQGCGCYLCGRERGGELRSGPRTIKTVRKLMTTETFKLSACNVHGTEHYNYDNVEYINNSTKVEIFCNIHNKFFKILPYSHIHPNTPKGCMSCSIDAANARQTKTIETFIEQSKELHGIDHYDYSCVDYVNTYTKIELVCNIHKYKFKVVPSHHLYKKHPVGCKYCTCSRGEGNIRNALLEFGYSFGPEFYIPDCKYKSSLPFDFVVFNSDKSIKCLLEFQGQHHYFPVNFGGCSDEAALKNHKATLRNDKIKSDYCQKNGIPLLCIHYSDINNIPTILSQFIRSLDDYLEPL